MKRPVTAIVFKHYEVNWLHQQLIYGFYLFMRTFICIRYNICSKKIYSYYYRFCLLLWFLKCMSG